MADDLKGAQEGDVSHRDLLDAHKLLEKNLGTHILVTQGIQKDVGEIKTTLVGLVSAVGKEWVSPEGVRLGDGLYGRVIQGEKRDRRDEDQRKMWINRFFGALWAFALILPLVWWLTRPTLDRVFHPQPASIVNGVTR